MTFYKQLMQSAVSIVAQANLSGSGGPQYQLTRAFVIGRVSKDLSKLEWVSTRADLACSKLPSLLASFEKAVEVDGAKPDWVCDPNLLSTLPDDYIPHSEARCILPSHLYFSTTLLYKDVNQYRQQTTYRILLLGTRHRFLSWQN